MAGPQPGQQAAQQSNAPQPTPSLLRRIKQSITPPPPPPILTTDDVLREEFAALWGGAEKVEKGFSYNEAAKQVEPAALCISGGGIRSATFALGVLQALADRGLLKEFHYLSTVSGGGYIGGWLSRWIRARKAQIERKEPVPPHANGPIGWVEAELKRSVTQPHNVAEISHLRDNANYLTPKLGIFSRDLWTAISIVVRNIVLNWLIFGPALLLLAMIPSFVLSFASGLDAQRATYVVWIGLAFAVLATLYAYTVLPGAKPGTEQALREHSLPTEKTVFLLAAIPVLLHSTIIGIVVAAMVPPSPKPFDFSTLFTAEALAAWSPDSKFYPMWWTAAVVLSAAVVAEGIARHKYWKHMLASFVVLACIAFVSFELLATGIYLLRLVPQPEAARVLAIGLGPIWVTGTALFASTLYVGFRYVKFGGEFDREWLGRLSALKVMPALLWFLLAIACLLLPTAVFDKENLLNHWLAAAIAFVTGPVAAWGGNSAKTVVDAVASPKERKRAMPINLIVTVATYLFFLALLMLLSEAEHAVACLITDSNAKTCPKPAALLMAHVCIFLGLVALVLVTSSRIKVNRYSMQALYRNRLMRGFLGAAVPRRLPDPFTGFDFRDDIRVAALESSDGTSRKLFHVINLCLNTGGSAIGSKQERKAESFVVTPLHAGSDALGPHKPGAAPPGAYTASANYAGSEPYREGGDYGIHLSTAITISGAAANPSMGYHSSPATALLLTLFNLRLGSWLPNPGFPGASAKQLRRSGPGNALRPLVVEMLGLTSDTSKYLQLSDGGHFENLGLYEMVRRRCRYILVIDSGCDPKAEFEDLGGAVRKCRLDFGVEITFRRLPIAARGKRKNMRAFAIGQIDYQDGKPGILIYLKPGYRELADFLDAMPVDLRYYASQHPEFPHEGTGDQWFSESQFESYRKLGFELAAEMLWQFGTAPISLPDTFRVARDMAEVEARPQATATP